jgi:hypothetical protein
MTPSRVRREPEVHAVMPSRRPIALALAAMLLAAACGGSGGAPSPSAGGAAAPTATLVPSPAATATPSPTATATPVPTPTPEPDVLPAALSGVLVDAELADRLPLAVMLDDARVARPQSGFNGASVVWQATADGYESRYMLVFGEGDADAVGPVRSARYFLVQWAQETRSVLAHYGGDQRSRTYIKYHPDQFTSVDGLGRGRKAYHRVKSRPAPHNAYTTSEDLRAMGERLGAPETMPADLHRRPFRDPSPLEARGETQRIRIPYRTNVITYAYDRESNRYRRSIDGKRHVDPADGERVAPTNVIVLFQKFRIDTKIEPGHSRPVITTIGRGRALVFREGRVVEGTWRKKDDVSPTRVFAEDGTELHLVRGQTFIQVVPTGTKVTVKD